MKWTQIFYCSSLLKFAEIKNAKAAVISCQHTVAAKLQKIQRKLNSKPTLKLENLFPFATFFSASSGRSFKKLVIVQFLEPDPIYFILPLYENKNAKRAD